MLLLLLSAAADEIITICYSLRTAEVTSYPCEVADVEHELLAGVVGGSGGERGAGVLGVGGFAATVTVC